MNFRTFAAIALMCALAVQHNSRLESRQRMSKSILLSKIGGWHLSYFRLGSPEGWGAGWRRVLGVGASLG